MAASYCIMTIHPPSHIIIEKENMHEQNVSLLLRAALLNVISAFQLSVRARRVRGHAALDRTLTYGPQRSHESRLCHNRARAAVQIKLLHDPESCISIYVGLTQVFGVVCTRFGSLSVRESSKRRWDTIPLQQGKNALLR